MRGAFPPCSCLIRPNSEKDGHLLGKDLVAAEDLTIRQRVVLLDELDKIGPTTRRFATGDGGEESDDEKENDSNADAEKAAARSSSFAPPTSSPRTRFARSPPATPSRSMCSTTLS